MNITDIVVSSLARASEYVSCHGRERVNSCRPQTFTGPRPRTWGHRVCAPVLHCRASRSLVRDTALLNSTTTMMTFVARCAIVAGPLIRSRFSAFVAPQSPHVWQGPHRLQPHPPSAIACVLHDQEKAGSVLDVGMLIFI